MDEVIRHDKTKFIKEPRLSTQTLHSEGGLNHHLGVMAACHIRCKAASRLVHLGPILGRTGGWVSYSMLITEIHCVASVDIL